MTENAAEMSLAARLETTVAEPAWLNTRRAEAAAAFRANGFPHSKLEDWRFTSLADVRDRTYESSGDGSAREAIARAAETFADSFRLVVVDGVVDPARSDLEALPDGVSVGSLRKVLELDPERLQSHLCGIDDVKPHALAALNTAAFVDGAFIEFEAGVEVAWPIHVIYAQSAGAEPTATFPRTLVVAGHHARGTVVEHFVSNAKAGSLCVPHTEVRLDDGAHVDCVHLNELPNDATLLGAIAGEVGRTATLRTHAIAVGGELARLEIRTRLDGEGAHTDLFGLSLGRERQLLDHHTSIDHALPQTTSHELYKGIYDDRSSGVFHGRIVVRPDAQRIDARQNNRNLVLSDGASVNTKPQLEIYADDVKCAHGATVGQLDPESLFYLRSRGIDFATARAMLTYAFASEVIGEIPNAELRARLEHQVMSRLPGDQT